MNEAKLGREYVLGALINTASWQEVLFKLNQWALDRASRYICICNAHSVVTAARNQIFREIVNQADMATPDGMPVVWVLRALGFGRQQRINGPDLMWALCQHADKNGLSIYLYGSLENTLSLLRNKLETEFPKLIIKGQYAPPFRPLTQEEDIEVVERINSSGAGVVFVSLGCPKQEMWMAAHRGKINAVMIGVGAAFEYHAGTIKRAPLWMQHAGLEWFYRLISEPRRLWRRYLVTNTLFIILAARQLASAFWHKHFRQA